MFDPTQALPESPLAVALDVLLYLLAGLVAFGLGAVLGMIARDDRAANERRYGRYADRYRSLAR